MEGDLNKLHKIFNDSGVKTVCESAVCPNIGDCFAKNTATFMILGNICTRGCRFCAVGKGVPVPPDTLEPAKVVKAVRQLRLKHVVITSVTRDDLEDGGAGQFARVIRALNKYNQNIKVEVLVPDFRGKKESIASVVDAAPAVIGHNVETVPDLYERVRPGADYFRSLALLKEVKNVGSGTVYTKSGIMLGLGEIRKQVIKVMEDLREVECDVLTVGQYLRPTFRHLPVVEYVSPEKFKLYAAEARDLGFKAVAAGPFIRSSYLAASIFADLTNNNDSEKVSVIHDG